MKRGIAGILVLNILLFSSVPGWSQEAEPKDIPRETRFTSLHKSLLIPGWGQFAEKRYIEAALFLSAEIFVLYKVFDTNHKGNQYYDKYREADNVDDVVKYRELTEKYDTRRNQYILVAIGVWALNLIDIYLIVKNKKKNNLRLTLNSGIKKLAFTLSYRF
ncbi:DUF5683 domain-containing protein [Acidobacteriota bacterium]